MEQQTKIEKRRGRPRVQKSEIMKVKTIRMSELNHKQKKLLAKKLNTAVSRTVTEDEVIRFLINYAADNVEEISKMFKEHYKGDKHRY